MTLRARLAALTAAAVALTIVAGSLSLWILIQSSLLGQIDERLLERVPDIERIAVLAVRLPPGEEVERGDIRIALQADPIGVQLLAPDGSVTRELVPDDLDLPLVDDERRLFKDRSADPQLRTVTAGGERYRVMATSVADGEAVLRLVQPLAGVEATMRRIAWLLAAVAGAGVAAAGGLGWVTARAALRPVDRLVAAAEQVATTKDLAHRIGLSGGHQDEITRLADAVDAMLAALDEARRQQRELVENAAHELRTPLATLRNDLGLLVRAEHHPDRTLDPDDRTALLRDLDAEAAALTELVAELIDLARGDVEPEPRLETDVLALIERAVARTRRVDPGVAIEVRGEAVEAAVRPAALERAVANLIRNAVQVSEDGGVVEVFVDEAEGWLTLQVLDRGPGIAAEDLDRLFDRFYRGAAARERHGSGLGLAIVAQAAELHDGSVDASNRPGGGAVFTLRVPVAGAASP